MDVRRFASMYTGDLVGRGAAVLAIWGYVLTHIRPTDGFVELNPLILTSILGEGIEDVMGAIEILCEPDELSESPEIENGRKLIQVSLYLYKVVDANNIQRCVSKEGRKKYMKEYMRAYRQKGKENVR